MLFKTQQNFHKGKDSSSVHISVYSYHTHMIRMKESIEKNLAILTSDCTFHCSLTVWVFEFVLKSNGFYVSPSVLPDVDTSVITSNLPSAHATYRLTDVQVGNVVDAIFTFSLILDGDVKLTDYTNFVSILDTTYTKQSVGK